MSTSTETSDTQFLDLVRRSGPMTISELMKANDVTATAVRQRLGRLMGQGLIERTAHRGTRGRPSHRYGITEKGRRRSGSNYADLALVLWDEIRSVQDPDVRRGLLARVAQSMAKMYRDQVGGESLTARMECLAKVFAERGVPLTSSGSASLPVLTIVDCPYPDLAERDRGICAVEKMLFQELLNHDIHLSQCRLDGHACCEFASS